MSLWETFSALKADSEENSPIMRKSNSFEIVYFSSLPASLTKILLKVMALSYSQKIFRCSRASNFEVDRPIWPEFERVRDFMFVPFTGEFDDDPVQNTVAILSTNFSPLQPIGQLLELKDKQLQFCSRNWPEFGLVRDFICVLVTFTASFTRI